MYTNRFRLRWWCLTAALTIALTLYGERSLRATPLDLPQTFPDMSSGFVFVDYTAATGEFQATGTPSQFTLEGPGGPNSSGTSYSIFGNAVFTIDAQINQTDGQLLSGTVEADGLIPALNADSGVLFTGNLTNFGYNSAGGNVFEFMANVTGGDLYAGQFLTGQVGLILDARFAIPGDQAFNGSFTQDFSNPNSFSGTLDAFEMQAATIPMPEPASWLLLLVGGLPLGARRWWRKKRSSDGK